jgi:hypothetical protein
MKSVKMRRKAIFFRPRGIAAWSRNRDVNTLFIYLHHYCKQLVDDAR